ncbi:MAG: BON domain-containing protein [Deltaproteobacteria bacterium]
MQETIGSTKSAHPADVHLTKNVDRALRATGYLALRDLQVVVSEGFVILRGKVPSYHLKQVAQATALGVPGVLEVENELEVVSTKQRG